RNLSGAAQMPAHERITEQLSFGQNPELKRKVRVQHRNIQRGEMIHYVNVRLGGIDLLEALNSHVASDRAQDDPRPQTRKAVLHMSVAIEQRRQERQCPENNGVQPDQRVEDEIRTQA